jgi:DinB superfamily
MRSLTLLLLTVATTVHAQSNARLALLDDWHHQHLHILATIDSATPAMLGFRTTPGVRTFAEQIYHVDEVAARIVSGAVTDRPLPPELLGDTAATLHDRAKLRAQTDRVFQFILSALESMSDEQMAEDKRAFGGSMPRFRWNVTALQHSAWTLGQTVPYLRMNGRTPPQFTPF